MKYFMIQCYCLAFLILFSCPVEANTDSVYIRVHFLHGSKPKRAFRHTEDRWFGGLLGGHAGVEYEPNKILNFQPKSGFHIFTKPNLINSKFSIHDTISFYEILGGPSDSAKKTIIRIKISAAQQMQLDSLSEVYGKRAPYDYAFFGMRCGAASYDLLSTIRVVPDYSFSKTWRKTFYPRKLRRRLEAESQSKHYSVVKIKGSARRNWEKD